MKDLGEVKQVKQDQVCFYSWLDLHARSTTSEASLASLSVSLTFTTLWAESEDDKWMLLRMHMLISVFAMRSVYSIGNYTWLTQTFSNSFVSEKK